MQNQSDDIDLFNMVATLWRGRFTIALITLLCIAAAAAYAYTAKEVWTSRAQVITPTTMQLGNYLEAERVYSIFNKLPQGSSAQTFSNNAFNRFVINLNSADLKKEYIAQSSLYKDEAALLDSETEKNILLASMVRNNFNIKETTTKNSISYVLSASAQKASDAYEALLGYIRFINEATLVALFEDLQERVQYRIAFLKQEIINIQASTEQNLANRISALEIALKIAHDAGIHEYTGQSTTSGNTIINMVDNHNLFMFGTKNLSAQIKSLEGSKPIYPLQYYQNKTNVAGLEKILEIKPTGMSYSYAETPNVPLQREKPSKLISLVLGALLGVVLGCALVLILNAYRARKEMSSL